MVTALYAQNNTAPVFKSLTVDDGLPQAFVADIVQDKTGFIWVSTRAGLARYDGKSFKKFYHLPYDKSTIANNIIESMFLDSHDRLWILYETWELDILDTRTEKITHVLDDPVFSVFKKDRVQHGFTYEDIHGNIWIKGPGNGLWQVDPDKRLCRFYPSAVLGAKDKWPWIILKHPGYDLTFVADSAVIGNKLVNGRYESTVLYKHYKQIPREVSYKPNADLVIFNWDSTLTVHNLKTNRTFTMPAPNGRVQATAVDDKNNLYFVIGTRIYKLSADYKISEFADLSSPRSFLIQSLLIDRSGSLWAGINADGIKITDLRLPPLATYTYKRNFIIDVFHNTLKVPLNEIDTAYLYDPYLLRAAAKDGGIWFGRASDYSRSHPRLYFYKNHHIKLPGWHYLDTMKSLRATGNAFAVSATGKLWGFDGAHVRLNYDDHTNLVTADTPRVKPHGEGFLSGLLIDGESVFWMSAEKDGLYRYDSKAGKYEHYLKNDVAGSLPVDLLMNIINDPHDKNFMWIASLGGGLIKFNKTTRKCSIITIADGLPDNTVYAIFADKKGVLWGSTNNGLFSFNPQTNKINTYTTKDGLIENEFNRFHAMQLPSGQLAFGGLKGYTVFDPLNVFKDDYEPAVAITAIKVNNNKADFGGPGALFKQAINNYKKITLNYEQNFLEFEFAGLEYNRPEKVEYRYQLVNYDNKWNYNGSTNKAIYTRLPPGDYILRINSTNTSGHWSSHVKELKIIILPPFWLTWWFIWFSSSVVIFIIAFLLRYRINSIRKQEKQRSSYEMQAVELEAQALRAQMNPHFIFNCLNSIKHLIQKNDQQNAISYLTIFSKLIRSQLNNTHKEISLAEEIHTCKLYLQLEELRFNEKITWRFNVDEEVDVYSIALPPLILQPFIENAVWHGIMPKEEGGTIIISLKNKGDYVTCEVDDDGIGRAASMANKFNMDIKHESKGMHLIQERLKLHNALNNSFGTIEIIDKVNEAGETAGTRIIISLKKQL